MLSSSLAASRGGSVPLHSPRAVAPAALLQRTLAFFVDYLVLVTLTGIWSALRIPPNLDAVFSFSLGVLYFGWCHSKEGNGQTLGKHLFHIQVLRYNPEGTLSHLTLLESIARFVYSGGLIILFSELPPFLYRTFAITGALWELELNMWGSLVLFFIDVAYVLSTPGRRSLHDALVRSVVVPKDTAPSGPSTLTLSWSVPRAVFATVSGTLVASFFWWLGLVQDPTLARISSHRYVLEHHFPYRFLLAKVENDTLVLHVIDTRVSGFGTEEMESLQLANLVRKLLAEGAMDTTRIASVELHILPNAVPGSSTKLRRFLVKTADFSVTSLDPPLS